MAVSSVSSLILIKLLASVSAVKIYIYTGESEGRRSLLRPVYLCLTASGESHEIISTIDYVTKGFVGHHAVKFRQQVLFTVFISLLYRGLLY